jgi:hypothetical protein
MIDLPISSTNSHTAYATKDDAPVIYQAVQLLSTNPHKAEQLVLVLVLLLSHHILLFGVQE